MRQQIGSLILLVLHVFVLALVGSLCWWFLAPEGTREVTVEQLCILELRHGKYSGFRFYAKCPSYTVWLDDIDYKSGLKGIADDQRYRCVFVSKVGLRTGWESLVSHKCVPV